MPGKWPSPLPEFRRIRESVRGYARYAHDWRTYARLPNAEPLELENAFPCLSDRTSTTPFDSHYFYQSIWAAQAIKNSEANEHVDVGSSVMFVGMLTPFTHVTFIDIRPLPVTLPNFESKAGDILNLPFPDNSIHSLSCLHVAEHIGLGRYGDALEPLGTLKAAKELARVLAPGGSLYFSLPIGKPRLCFNAHRIHSPAQILAYFGELSLVRFSVVDDEGVFRLSAETDDFSGANYACGLFHFTRN